MAAARSKLRSHVSGRVCESLGCYEIGLWYVELPTGKYHLCAKHLVLCMKSPESLKVVHRPRKSSLVTEGTS